nr:MAG TPA: hypothetical protein [Caudoviricetes sp.]
MNTPTHTGRNEKPARFYKPSNKSPQRLTR